MKKILIETRANSAKPVRVAQIMGKLNAGGVESFIYNYYRHIDHSRVQFDFYADEDSTFAFPKDILSMGAQCFTVPPYQKPFDYCSVLIHAFQKNRYAIVHSHINSLAVLPLYAAWYAHVPVRICHSHSTASFKERGRAVLKYMLRPFASLFATDLMACSEQAGRWLFGNRRFEDGQVRIMQNAISLNRFAFSPFMRRRMSKELGLQSTFVIGHVGRFMPQKNHTFLIDIFAEVCRKEPKAKLLLVGDGKLRNEIEDKVHRLGLSDAVVFTGNVTNTEQYYQVMDVLCFPSIFEGLGMVAVEAQAAGLPVVASDEIPSEVAVSKSFVSVSLSESAGVWAEKLLKSREFPRETCVQELQDSGFNIRQEAEKLERFYIDRWNECLSRKIMEKSGGGTSLN